jgi:thiopeptide-type bacteriocin biosynthesis protein
VTPPVWLYYKAYAGGTTGGVEQLVAETVPAVLAQPIEVSRWFFIRYTDEGGGHLRLRMRVRPDAQPAIEEILRSGIERLPAGEFPVYRPAVDVASFGAPLVETGAPRIETASYEPELESFGAMEIAEAVFEASSEIAVRIIHAERAGRCSRKSLAPIFMRDALNIFAPDEPHEYWRKYAHHWLLYRTDWIGEWLPRFEAKYAQLAASSIPVFMPDDVLAEDARNAVVAWRHALTEAVRAYTSAESRPAWPVLAFRFMHLMNNRLGFNPAEESYFATLIRCEEEHAA